MTESISKEEKALLVKGYTAMVLARTLDKKLVSAQRQGRIGFYTPMMGQEASQVGLSMALLPEDFIYGYYRDIGLLIYRGGSIEALLNQAMGNSADSARGRQMPSHLMDKSVNFFTVPSMVGANLTLAVGTAYAYKMRKRKGIVAATFGDGATSTPDFHASMNFASVYDVPVLFFCENNQWAISYPVEKQSKTDISEKAKAYGIRGLKVDGNNLVDVYRTTRQAVESIRAGEGPILINAVSYRMGPHSTSDDPSKYRKDEISEGSDRDPLVVTEKLLISMKVMDEHLPQAIKSQAEKIVDSKFEESEKIPPASPEETFTDVYAEDSWMLQEERGDLL